MRLSNLRPPGRLFALYPKGTFLLVGALLGAGLLLAGPACDSRVEDEPEPVDLPAGTFEVTLDGAKDMTLSGEAGFFNFDLTLPDSLDIPLPGGGSPFVVSLTPDLTPDGETGPRPMIQLQRLSGGRPSEGEYSVVPTSLANFAVSVTTGGEVYQPQNGTVEVVSSSKEKLTARIDARLTPGFRSDGSGETLRVEGAFHAVRDTSLDGSGFAFPSRAAAERRSPAQ